MSRRHDAPGWRQQQREDHELSGREAADTLSPEDLAAAAEQAQQLGELTDQVLAGLPDELRQVIETVLLGEQSYRQAAVTLGVSKSEVGRRVAQALRALRGEVVQP